MVSNKSIASNLQTIEICVNSLLNNTINSNNLLEQVIKEIDRNMYYDSNNIIIIIIILYIIHILEDIE